MSIKFARPKTEETRTSPNVSSLPSPTDNIAPPLPLESQDSEAPKRRGRPPGSTTKRQGKVIPLDVEPPIDADMSEDKPEQSAKGKPGRKKKVTFLSKEQLSNQIFGLHAFLAVVVPGTEITKMEADMLAVSMVDVAEAYGLTMSPKITALIGLAAAVGIVELPVAIKVRNHFAIKRANQNAIRRAQMQARQPEQTVVTGEPTQGGETIVIGESINYGNGIDSRKKNN